MGTGISGGGGGRIVEVARVGEVAGKRGRADGGACARGPGEIGMRLRFATQAKITAAAQRVGPFPRSMVSSYRELESTAARATG